MLGEWSDRRDALPQGSVLRDYTIEEVLGHGGFGIVYKARHNELDHVVAIKEYLPSELAVREGKTIRARSADCETYFADGLRRFREEARALIDFQQHPSIVDCRDFFRANGTAYLVMEYVEGLPLSELLRQRESAGRPFTESDLLGIAMPLAEGLAHIHRAGVIHRDIKPANILVRSTDQQPVLIDFGAAKQAVAEHSRSLAPYTEGYAALEQVADGQLGQWTDLYGFGAVLWRMVAGGNRPWDPPNPVKVESRANAGLRDAEDPLPTARELGVGRFADRLLELIDGCLRLKDTDRIRDSDRVLHVLRGSGEGGSLQSATAGQPAEGGHAVDRPDPVSEEPRTGRSSGRRLWKVVGVAAVIAMVVALAAVALIPRNGTVEMPDRWSFSIEAEPSTATVALLNGPEAYRPGMLLAPGQYEVEVSAPGFVTQRERVTHLESETLHHVELVPRPEPEPIPTTSSDVTRQPTDSTVAEREDAPSEVPIVSEPIAVDPVVAKDQESTGGESQDTCGDGDFEDCFELGQRYRLGLGVQIDLDRAAEFYELACDGEHAEGCRLLRILGFMYRDGHGVPHDSTRAARLFELACNGGDGRACWLFARMTEQGNGVTLDRERAVQLYQQACDGGDSTGCWSLGVLYRNGEGVDLDLGLAAAYFERACNGGNANGCSSLGYMYDEGEGVPVDPARAAKLFEQACDGGDAYGCRRLGILHRDGEGVLQDPKLAAELFGRACSSEDAIGCRILGYMYAEGEGVPVDPARAMELFEQACDSGDATGCWSLGYRYQSGNGVSVDLGRAAESYQRSCDGGDAAGCSSLGYMFDEGEGVPLDRKRAAELYQRACDGEHAFGCWSLGDLYQEGEGVPMDRARAAELYEQACDGEQAGSCNQLGLLYDRGHGVSQDHVHAAELFHRACEGGSANGCTNLGTLYANGEGVRQDRARAAELYRRACDGDSMAGCHNLGLSYYQGRGVGQDRSVAASLFRRACANGNQGACEKLETLDWR